MKHFLTAVAVASLIVPTAFAGGDKKSSAKAKEARVQEINKNPSAWLNKKVKVEGEVEHVPGKGAFVLDGEGFANDRILVVGQKLIQSDAQASNQEVGKESGSSGSASKDMPTFKVDDKVSLDGTVRQMTVMEVERQYSTDLDPEVEVEFEGSVPVLVADLSQVKKRS